MTRLTATTGSPPSRFTISGCAAPITVAVTTCISHHWHIQLKNLYIRNFIFILMNDYTRNQTHISNTRNPDNSLLKCCQTEVLI